MSINPSRFRTIWLTVALLLAGLPLAGVLCTGRYDPAYLEFPPTTRYIDHAPFHPGVFLAMAVGIILFAGWMLYVLLRRRPGAAPVIAGTFPRWGWGAGLALAVGWWLAWSRQDWFAPFQVYTYSLLWYPFILLLNAAAIRLTGSSPMTSRPRWFLTLFPVSAGFWWFFEYLNRFVQNWWYHGVESFSAGAYVIHATISFATVLPAFVSMYAVLSGLLGKPCEPLLTGHRYGGHRFWPLAVLASGSVGLFLMGVFPNLLYPLVWIAPLVLLEGMLSWTGRPSLIMAWQPGDHHRMVRMMLAALACGFFWELWNMFSLAHWTYDVSWVEAFYVFEMPLLGYAGYLPFGLECGLIAGMLRPGR